jgi:hypothetical protein
MLATKPLPTGSIVVTNTIGTVRLTCSKSPGDRVGCGEHDVGSQRDQFRSVFPKALGVSSTPASVDPHVAADFPTQLLQSLQESRITRLPQRILGREIHEHADPPHSRGLLRACREGPGHRCATE